MGIFIRQTIFFITAFLFLVGSFQTSVANEEEDQTGILKGVIVASDNTPAADVEVEIKELHRVAFTDINGRFFIQGIKPGNYTLQVSLIGYENIAQAVHIQAGKTTSISVTVQLTQKQLKQVIVTTTRNKFTKNVSNYVAKMPLNKMENPQVYTTITKALLNEQLVFTVDDATRNT